MKRNPAAQLTSIALPTGYEELLRELKQRVQAAQVRAALAVNRELVFLYWSIGRDILTRQQAQGWGAKVIEHLSTDLRRAFPEMKGFSTRNLEYMQTLASAYPDEQFAQQVVARIPWGHNVVILDKVQDRMAREWFLNATYEHGWSRNVLAHQIETNLYARQGKAITNFESALPAPQSDLAQQVLKDPYNFDFLTLYQDARERELQEGLVEHIRQFLLELGSGFSFVGSPYRIEVGSDEFEMDMLFYHLKLRCFVVIDLKIGKFAPQDAGQMNFYLSAVDDLLRHPSDGPSIGLILCKAKNEVVAEYALRDIHKPIGVVAHLTREIEAALPEEFKHSLPTIEEIEAELAGVDAESGKQDTDG